MPPKIKANMIVQMVHHGETKKKDDFAILFKISNSQTHGEQGEIRMSTYIDFGAGSREIAIRWCSIFDKLEDFLCAITQPSDLK